MTNNISDKAGGTFVSGSLMMFWLQRYSLKNVNHYKMTNNKRDIQEKSFSFLYVNDIYSILEKNQSPTKIQPLPDNFPNKI